MLIDTVLVTSPSGVQSERELARADETACPNDRDIVKVVGAGEYRGDGKLRAIAVELLPGGRRKHLAGRSVNHALVYGARRQWSAVLVICGRLS